MAEYKYITDDGLTQIALEVKSRVPTKTSELTNDSGFGSMWYGECTTAQTTTAKVVTITGFTSANLVKGTIITVKFSNAAHASSAQTLNVSGTGAKSIVKYGSTSSAGGWVANQTITLAYDGTYWRMVDYQQNTDANVKQTLNTNTNATYPILFKGDTTTQEKTQGTLFNSNVTINPATGTLSATKFVGDGSGMTNTPNDKVTTSVYHSSNAYRHMLINGYTDRGGADAEGNAEPYMADEVLTDGSTLWAKTFVMGDNKSLVATMSAVSSKQDALSDTQLVACNSGITADKVATYDGLTSVKKEVVTISHSSDIKYWDTGLTTSVFPNVIAVTVDTDAHFCNFFKASNKAKWFCTVAHYSTPATLVGVGSHTFTVYYI